MTYTHQGTLLNLQEKLHDLIFNGREQLNSKDAERSWGARKKEVGFL